MDYQAIAASYTGAVMKTRKAQAGFTLTELAIVVTIIGILTAGFLQGHEFLENAKVNGTVSQITAIKQGVINFVQFYGRPPGDLTQPQVRLPNYPTDGRGIPPAATAGDGAVGKFTWGVTGGYAAQMAAAGMTPAAPTVGDETELFWIQLTYAGFVTGVTPTGLETKTAPAWGVTHPSASIGGGFIVGHADGSAGAQRTPGAPDAIAALSGLVYAIETLPNTDLGTTANQQPLTPLRAGQIDRKMDDGRPETGLVRGYGTTASCFTAAGVNAYNESVTSKDCGVIIMDNKN